MVLVSSVDDMADADTHKQASYSHSQFGVDENAKQQ